MLEDLRKKSKRSTIIKVVIFMIIVAVFMIISKASFIDYLQGPIDLGKLSEWDEEELDGKYVTLELNSVLWGFAEETSTDQDTKITKVTSTCYFSEFYDETTDYFKLFAIKTQKADDYKIQMVMNDKTYTTTYRITGTFQKMSGEILQYYNEMLDDYVEAEYLEYTIPYCIYDKTIGGIDNVAAIILHILAFVFLVLSIITIINYLRGNYDRYMKRYLHKNQRESMLGIEADYTSATEINNNYRVGRKYFFYSKGGTFGLVPLKDQVWAYYYYRSGDISASQIRFFDLKQKRTCVNISKQLAYDVLAILSVECKHMVIGFDKEWKKLYSKNMNEFLNLRYHPSKAAEAEQNAYYAEKDSTIENS